MYIQKYGRTWVQLAVTDPGRCRSVEVERQDFQSATARLVREDGLLPVGQIIQVVSHLQSARLHVIRHVVT